MTEARPPLSNPSATAIMRWLGYGLIVFAAVDVLAILYPPDFTNPEWELQLIGQLVERAPVPLLGFGFVFFGSQNAQQRPMLERLLLKSLSYICVLLALAFLALVPLGISDTFRVNNNTVETIETRLQEANQQIEEQLRPFKEQVTQANPADLQGFVERLQAAAAAAEEQNQQDRINPQIANLIELTQDLSFEGDPAAAKQTLLERLDERITSQKVALQQRADNDRSRARKALLENSVKWNFGALLTSALYLMIYLQTDWVRKLPIGKKKSKKPQAPPRKEA